METVKEKKYKRKPENMIRFWMNKLMQEKKANLVVAEIETSGKCKFKFVIGNKVDAYTLTKTQDTKPKKLWFEVNGKMYKYASVRKAAEGLGVARPTITALINGKTKRSFALESVGIKFVGKE